MHSDQYAAVINADDFGQTESCTRAIWEAFQKGLITDTTMVANGEAMELAFRLLAENSQLQDRVGIHFILSEGTPLTQEMRNNPKFVTDGRFNSYFCQKSNFFRSLQQQDRADLYRELTAQAELLKDRGVSLSHADSHHHVHCCWALLPVVLQVCREQGIHRIRTHKNLFSGPHLKGRAYAAAVNLRIRAAGFSAPHHFEALRNYRQLPGGISELMVHPDYDEAGELIDRTGRRPDGSGTPEGIPLAALVAQLSLEDSRKVSYRSV